MFNSSATRRDAFSSPMWPKTASSNSISTLPATSHDADRLAIPRGDEATSADISAAHMEFSHVTATGFDLTIRDGGERKFRYGYALGSDRVEEFSNDMWQALRLCDDVKPITAKLDGILRTLSGPAKWLWSKAFGSKAHAVLRIGGRQRSCWSEEGYELKAPSLPVEAFTVSYDLSAGRFFLLDGGFGAAARLVFHPYPKAWIDFDPACSRRQQSLVDRRRHSERAAKCERIHSWSHTLCNGAQGSAQRRRPCHHFETGQRRRRSSRRPTAQPSCWRPTRRPRPRPPQIRSARIILRSPRKPRPRHPAHQLDAQLGAPIARQLSSDGAHSAASCDPARDRARRFLFLAPRPRRTFRPAPARDRLCLDHCAARNFSSACALARIFSGAEHPQRDGADTGELASCWRRTRQDAA